MLSIGIVGLPNVGKSTLFNALTKSKQADAQNYPFCTIEPNVGVVAVPDARLASLAPVEHSKKIVPTAIEFWDIAGLVKNASQGEGKGNAFLSNIKETNAIIHVVRAFSDNNIIHVENRIHPKDDADIINLELILADLRGVESRLDKAKKRAKGVVPKDLALEILVLEKIAGQLGAGKRASGLSFTEDEMVVVKELHLITMKPMLYVVNIDDAQHADTYRPIVEDGVPHIYISAKTEAELCELSPEDAAEFMKELGMQESGLDTMIRAGYELLGLVTFFTCGEIETRAWTVEKNTKAPLAAGTIHTDFIKGFIKADVVNWKDFVEHGGWGGIKGTGKLRLEGKEYLVQDGDVVYFQVS